MNKKSKILIYLISIIFVCSAGFALTCAIYGRYPLALTVKYSILPIMLMVVGITLRLFHKHGGIFIILSSLLLINLGIDANLLSRIKEPVYSDFNQMSRLDTQRNATWININLFPNIIERNKQINNYPNKSDVIATESEYNEFINKDEHDKVIVFYKIGCKYCESAHRTIHNASIKYNVQDHVRYINYESDLAHKLENKYDITRSTTMLLFKGTNDPEKIQQNIFKNGIRTLEPNKDLINDLFKSLSIY